MNYSTTIITKQYVSLLFSMKKRIKYIKPKIVFIDIEICDVILDASVGSTHTESAGGNGGDGEHSKQEDFIFDTTEDFDSPYYIFE